MTATSTAGAVDPFGPEFKGAVPPALAVPGAEPDPADAALAWRVMSLFAFDDCDWLFWRFTDGRLTIYVNCNDVFAWGCSDVEELTAENLHDAAQAKADVMALGGKGSYNWPLLFCARQRKMRPQGAMYKHIDPALWPLFDAAGPPRQAGLGNPVAHPTEVTGTQQEGAAE